MFTTCLTELGTCALPWLHIKENLFKRFYLVQWHEGTTAEYLPQRRTDMTFERASGADNSSCLTAESEGAAKNPELARLWCCCYSF